jgi:hypothetical protein
VTRRDKRDLLNSGIERDSVTERPVGSPSRHATPDLEKSLALLRAEVMIYLNTYISRGYHAEGIALARLRKAAER